jgi:hypothetical protein
MTIARQRLGKHSPGVTLSTIEGHRLLGNETINKHSRTTEEKCFRWGPCRGNIRESNSEAGNCRSTEEYNGERERERERERE